MERVADTGEVERGSWLCRCPPNGVSRPRRWARLAVEFARAAGPAPGKIVHDSVQVSVGVGTNPVSHESVRRHRIRPSSCTPSGSHHGRSNQVSSIPSTVVGSGSTTSARHRPPAPAARSATTPHGRSRPRTDPGQAALAPYAQRSAAGARIAQGPYKNQMHRA